MVDDGLKKFAEELKSIREKKAISLSEIHDKTRIDLKYLNEIENGNFDSLPEVYMRAFLRKYATMLELDEDEILSKFEFAKGETSGEPSPPNTKKIELDQGLHDQVSDTFDDFEDETPVTETSKENGDKKNIVLFGGIGIIIISILLLYFVVFNSEADEIIIEKPVDEILAERNEEPEKPNLEAQSKSKETPKIVETQDSLSLIIQAVDTSWMRVMVDNKVTDEFILSPNLTKSLKAKTRFSLLVGNSGGVELTLNGNKLPKIGKKGQIKNIIVDSSGVHYQRIN